MSLQLETNTLQWVQVLTLVGVIWLLLKVHGVEFGVSKSNKNEGMGLGSRLGHFSQFSGANQASSEGRGYEGMSMSGYEAPVWHQTAVNPDELVMNSAWAAADHAAVGQSQDELNAQAAKERARYAKVASREGMGNKLEQALSGGTVGL